MASKSREQSIKSMLQDLEVPESAYSLVDISLTHKSFANEISGSPSPDPSVYNQRLEFLGDAVLGMIMAQWLYELHPNRNEGQLTHKKSRIVCEATLADLARQLDFSRLLLMGKGETATGGATRDKNLADALESFIGAVYLASGLETAKSCIYKLFEPYVREQRIVAGSYDFKSRLQEHVLKIHRVRPDYQLLDTHGPEHNKTFRVGLFIRGEKKSEGVNSSRKRSEQDAAEIYLKELSATGEISL